METHVGSLEPGVLTRVRTRYSPWWWYKCGGTQKAHRILWQPKAIEVAAATVVAGRWKDAAVLFAADVRATPLLLIGIRSDGKEWLGGQCLRQEATGLPRFSPGELFLSHSISILYFLSPCLLLDISYSRWWLWMFSIRLWMLHKPQIPSLR